MRRLFCTLLFIVLLTGCVSQQLCREGVFEQEGSTIGRWSLSMPEDGGNIEGEGYLETYGAPPPGPRLSVTLSGVYPGDGNVDLRADGGGRGFISFGSWDTPLEGDFVLDEPQISGGAIGGNCE